MGQFAIEVSSFTGSRFYFDYSEKSPKLLYCQCLYGSVCLLLMFYFTFFFSPSVFKTAVVFVYKDCSKHKKKIVSAFSLSSLFINGDVT